MKYMLVSNEEKIANEWKKYQGYTIRPLPSTLSYCGEIIASHAKTKKFMLYGGTPEFRSIFQKLHYNVTLIDRSLEMVRAMGLLTQAQMPLSDNERFLYGDWLKLNHFKEQFDILIGDDAINMVKWSDFELFLQQAWRRLRPGGLFVCHFLVKPNEELIIKKIEDVDKEFRRGIIKSSYDLASRLNFLCWDKTNYSMGWQKTIERFGRKMLAQFKPELDFVGTFGLCNSQFYCPPLPHFDRLVEQYFSIKEIFYPNEHDYCLFEPLYVLEKN